MTCDPPKPVRRIFFTGICPQETNRKPNSQLPNNNTETGVKQDLLAKEDMMCKLAESLFNKIKDTGYPVKTMLEYAKSFKQMAASFSDSLDSIPKAFLERSNNHHTKLGMDDKAQQLSDIVELMESEYYDYSKTSSTHKDSSDSPDFGITPVDDSEYPPSATPDSNSEPIMVTSCHETLSNKDTEYKRKNTAELYSSEDSNLSVRDEGGFLQYRNHFPYIFSPHQLQHYSDHSTQSFNNLNENMTSYPYSSNFPNGGPKNSLRHSDAEVLIQSGNNFLASYGGLFDSEPPHHSSSDVIKNCKKTNDGLKQQNSKLSKSTDLNFTCHKYLPDENVCSEHCEPSVTYSHELATSIDRECCTSLELARDQHGSRLLQQKIEAATPKDISQMISELAYDEEELVHLVSDVFGNYVIQKLLDSGNDDQRMAIVSKIRGSILILAIQMYGCRVVQKAIECGSINIKLVITQELHGHVLECIKDQNGNHVIQKCIEKIDPIILNFIIEEISGKVVELSTHPYGCRVIQRILEHFTLEQKQKITNELFSDIPALVMDQYGNYVVQHILDHLPGSSHRNFVFDYVRKNIFQLSSHKFASNVVEKCLISGSKQERIDLIREIIDNSIGTEDDVVYKMMKDAFANYVIQKMIDVITVDKEYDLFNSLVNKIRPHYPSLRKINYGKHIINKIDKIYMRMSNPRSPPNLQREKLNDQQSVSSSSKTSINNYCFENGNHRIRDSLFDDHRNCPQKQVIFDSLSEFPSLVDEGKMSSVFSD